MSPSSPISSRAIAARSGQPLKVWFICTGVGIMNRGVESLFRDAFDGFAPLAAANGVHVQLFKGRGPQRPDDHTIWCLPRTGWLAPLLGKLLHRNAYTIEQISAVPGVFCRIRAGRPDLIYFHDANLGMRLYDYRHWFGVPYKLLYCNGAPLPPPFSRVDHVQQVAPFYYEQAMAAGEPPAMHSQLPLGFCVPPGPPETDPATKLAARKQLGLPLDRPIVISVGWIAREHKRMDYTVSEIATLPQPRPYFLMLGAMDEKSPPIIELAREMLGAENFAARSVPVDQVNRYYQAADIFALASLQEGFGRVYVEALIQGLPAIVHDGPVMRFVLGDQGTFADLSKPGGLSTALAQLLKAPPDPLAPARRRESVRSRFSWEVLAPAYAAMFRSAVNQNPVK